MKMRPPGTAEEKQPFLQLLEPMPAGEPRFFDYCCSSLKEKGLFVRREAVNSYIKLDKSMDKPCYSSKTSYSISI